MRFYNNSVTRFFILLTNIADYIYKIIYPMKQAANETTYWSKEYPIKCHRFCLSTNIFTSSEDKVEKVVNPPRTPIISNGCIQDVCIVIPIIKPIKKLPIILTNGVAIGNGEVNLVAQ